ncbi:MAG: CPBP family intramembrane glutamic endopeptidase [Planctomycetota bacterium]
MGFLRDKARDVAADLRSFDGRAVVTLATAAFVLVALQFRGKAGWWRTTEFVAERSRTPLEADFVSQCCWAVATDLGFGVLPFLVAVLVLRMRPSELGFRFGGFFRHLGLYLALFAFMVPAILWAAERPDFRGTYPFPALARTDDHHFWVWQAFYFSQFAAVESFFRGFLLFPLERRFGLNAIFVSVIPYAMIHFSKPMPEAFGAVFAGIALGYLALKTRSFFGGILLHYLVAITMDLLATGRL